MPIRVVVSRERSQSSPAMPASGFAARPWRREAEAPASAGTAVVPPARPLVPVFASKEREAEAVRAAAQSGLRTPGVELPFFSQIRRAFQPHDLRGVRAHVGPAAIASTEAMQAEAYAAGEHVVLGGRPDLYTVAHEVAHVVQQRAGARPEGGVGRQEDVYERNADAAARAVEAGRPAAGLPPPLSPSRATWPAPVQRMKHRRSKRESRYRGSFAAQQVSRRRGISRSPYVRYPTPIGELAIEAFPEIRELERAHRRSRMPSRETQIAWVAAKNAAARTEQDERMLASPGLNMRDEGFSGNHKLADSSVATLMRVLWASIRQIGVLERDHEDAIMDFMHAMTGPEEADEAYDALMSAVAEDDPHRVTAYLQPGIQLLSMSMKNIRYGDSELNTLILWAFDPNLTEDRASTPDTENIQEAVQFLAEVDLVPRHIVEAALSQARLRSTDEPMSSSSLR